MSKKITITHENRTNPHGLEIGSKYEIIEYTFGGYFKINAGRLGRFVHANCFSYE